MIHRQRLRRQAQGGREPGFDDGFWQARCRGGDGRVERLERLGARRVTRFASIGSRARGFLLNAQRPVLNAQYSVLIIIEVYPAARVLAHILSGTAQESMAAEHINLDNN